MSVATASKTHSANIRVTVVTCQHGQIWQRSILIPVDSTAQQALDASGYLNDFPGGTISDIVLGVFGNRVAGSYRLVNHDRVEIYSPLQVDPKIARRRRAAHREKVKNIKKKMPVNDLTQP